MNILLSLPEVERDRLPSLGRRLSLRAGLTLVVMPEGQAEVNAAVCAGRGSPSENLRGRLDLASHLIDCAPGRVLLEKHH